MIGQINVIILALSTVTRRCREYINHWHCTTYSLVTYNHRFLWSILLGLLAALSSYDNIFITHKIKMFTLVDLLSNIRLVRS